MINVLFCFINIQSCVYGISYNFVTDYVLMPVVNMQWFVLGGFCYMVETLKYCSKYECARKLLQHFNYQSSLCQVFYNLMLKFDVNCSARSLMLGLTVCKTDWFSYSEQNLMLKVRVRETFGLIIFFDLSFSVDLSQIRVTGAELLFCVYC